MFGDSFKDSGDLVYLLHACINDIIIVCMQLIRTRHIACERFQKLRGIRMLTTYDIQGSDLIIKVLLLLILGILFYRAGVSSIVYEHYRTG